MSPHTVTVLNVLIASPSDVGEERDVVTSAIHAWNAAHSRDKGIMLFPIRWETHSYPASGDRPQAIINRQIVDEGDFLIGIFGSRLGTPTGEAQSGTIEEIERFRKAGKYVALYFSTADVPRNTDREQLKALEDYQRERQKDTLYGTFSTPDELRQLVTQHLPSIVSDVSNSLQLSPKSAILPRELSRTAEPLRVTTEFRGEYPDSIELCVSTNRNVRITEIDYLDERDVRIVSQRVDAEGQYFPIDIKYQELRKIHQLKPYSNYDLSHMAFRLHITDGDTHTTEKVPAALQPGYKPINNTSTYFLKLLG